MSDLTTVVTSVMECVAVASFAASGTIIAIQKRLDIAGALILSLLTTFGGGLMRDLVIGLHPPRLFTAEYLAPVIVCAAVSLLLFAVSFSFRGRAALVLTAHRHNILLEATDTVGLALFCVLGVDSAAEIVTWAPERTALLIFCGFVTGVGGGVLRDVCTAQIPSVFRKHIYLIPALLGSGLYVILCPHAGHLPALFVSVGLILIIRFLAIRFRWNLPTPLGKKPADGAEKAE